MAASRLVAWRSLAFIGEQCAPPAPGGAGEVSLVTARNSSADLLALGASVSSAGRGFSCPAENPRRWVRV